MRARGLDRLVRQGLCGAALLVIAVSAAAQGNPLPPLPKGHSPVSMGYYFIDGKFGDHWNEVTCYTNTYYATTSNYFSDLPWQADYAASIQRARAEGMRVTLGIDLTRCVPDDRCGAEEKQTEADQRSLDEKIALAQPYWDAIEAIELADEPEWTRAQIDRRVLQVVNTLVDFGLPQKPIGLTHQMSYINGLEGRRLSGSALDWVGVSAFLEPPGSPDPEVNRMTLISEFGTALEKTAPKDIVLGVQAYDRNGSWPNLATLVDLQSATYDLLAADTGNRIRGLRFFNYARENLEGCQGGTHYHPELKAPHRWIAERVFGVTLPAACAPPGTTPPCGPPSHVAAPTNLQAVAEGFAVELT